MAGVEETKQVLDLGLSIGKAVKDSLADGKLSLEDLVNVMTFVPKVGPAFENIDQVPTELSDLDEAEMSEIVALVVMRLPDITDDERAKKIAASALKVGLSIAGLVSAISSK